MRIPHSFQLGGITWEVEFKPNLVNALGATHSSKAIIQIEEKLSRQMKEQTFCHELVHAILFAMGKHTEPHDEVFVDAFGTFLHQYLTSKL